MKKHFYILVISLFIVCYASAQKVSLTEASHAAGSFLQSNKKTGCCLTDVIASGTDTLLYVFNSESSYVVISGDKRVPPVLAFSDHQLYNSEDLIPPARMWLDNYARQLSALKQQPMVKNAVNPAWRMLSCEKTPFKDGPSVAPLMKSHWGQGTFYNYYCPKDFAGENYHVVTGCVATAMAQLIYYYRFPETGLGSYSYLDSTYGVQSADYGNTLYDYNAMCDEPTAINPAICTLMHHCGVGVDMVYGPDGSGMYNHSAARVLRTFFKFSPETEYVFRDSTDLDWDSLIVAHLHRNMPLYYAGWSNPNVNGHGFICDGYRMVDSNYYYHFNFGWDGSYDNYFYTNALNLIGTHFNLAQELIINAYPDTTLYAYPPAHALTGTDTLTTLQGSFNDGSLTLSPYTPNMDYSWIISPDADYFTSISFHLEYDIASGDTLLISTDNPSIAQIILTDTNNTLNVEWNCSEITVRFVSNDSISGQGFRANYNANLPVLCPEVTNYSASSGTIEDGSGSDDYLPYTSCLFRIIVPSFSVIELNMEYLDLVNGEDFLYVFDNKPDNANLLATYTGHMEDTVIRFEKKRLALLIETDEQHNADGFKLTYQAGHVGVDDVSDERVAIFPNPAESVLSVSADEPMEYLSIFDLTGREVMHLSAADTRLDVPLEGLTGGVYIIRIKTSDNQIVKKFIKQ